ncbi:MAG: hypothetical protein EOM20_18020 [Spartobacteria bacterium]|nr:hypothetical protein [Spartobacteria bacterium]
MSRQAIDGVCVFSRIRGWLAGCFLALGVITGVAAEVLTTEPMAWAVDAGHTNRLQAVLDVEPDPGEVVWAVHSAWRGRMDGVGSLSSNVLEFALTHALLPGEPVTASVLAPGMAQIHSWQFYGKTAGGSGILMTNAQSLALDTGGFAVSNIALRMLCAADMNGDDAVDLLVPYWNSNRVAWLRNDLGGGVEVTMLSAPVGRRLLDVTVAALSANAGLDLLLGANDGALLAGYGDGNGGVTNWDSLLPGGTAPYRSVVQGDVNGDGWPDLIALAEDVGSGAALQMALNSNGVLVTGATLPLAGSSYALATGDINGDGRLDAVVAGNSGFVGVYTNNGQTLVVACETSINSRHLYACCLLDADGNGSCKIAVAGAEGYLALGALTDDHLTFEEIEQSVGSDTLYGLVAGDIDGDGDADLAAAGGSRVLSLMNDGTGTFKAQVAVEMPGESLRDAVLLDGNGDGALDLAVCGFLSGRVYLFWNPDAPTYNDLLVDQLVMDASPFAYVFLAGTFSAHVTGALAYELTDLDGHPAPAWLSVDSEERRIEAASPAMGIHNLLLVARDADGRETPAPWTLSVVPGLTTTTAGAGAMTPTGVVLVAFGSTTNFTFTPADYWHVDEVTTNGAAVEGAGTGFTWSNVTANGTIHVTFAPDLAAGGTPHWWLAHYGLTNSGFSFDEAELAHADDDGINARDEYLADTVPTNGESFFHLTGIDDTASTVITFGCTNSRIYSLQFTTNMVDSSWWPVHGATNISGTLGGTLSLTDTVDTIYRSYRVGVSLP